MALRPPDSLLLQSLNSSNIDATFFGLKRSIRSNSWIGKNNIYSTDTVEKIIRQINAGNIQDIRHLSQYVAASCLLHCADGWSYLGRSLSAMLRGDPHRCRHFSYYAELRAAMSLLASQGVGVFNIRHVVVDGKDSVVPLRGTYNTHLFAWDCLECWSGQPASGNLFADVIRPNGLRLDDWLAPLGGAIAVAPLAADWFQQWGMDLRIGSDDRDSRNVSSYRPDGLPNAWYLNGQNVVKFVHGLWSTLEPTRDSRFESIDKHILRFSIENSFKGRSGRTPSAAPKQFRESVAAILAPLDLAPEVEKLWSDFLTRRSYKQDPEIFALSKEPPSKESTSCLSIISRAALLLRVSSGAALRLMQGANLTADETRFWWDNLGVGRGVWHGPKNADDLLDFWADIDPLLKELESFQARHAAADQSFLRIGSELGPALAGLGSLERVAIWSMTA